MGVNLMSEMFLYKGAENGMLSQYRRGGHWPSVVCVILRTRNVHPYESTAYRLHLLLIGYSTDRGNVA